MTRFWPAASLFAAALALTACNAKPRSADAAAPRSITVSGEGEVMAKPDLATVTVGVTTEGDSANLALAENNTRMAAVLQAAGALGIPETDVRTSDLSVAPRYADPDLAKPGAPLRISGYSVSNTVALTVRDLGKLGAALDQFVSAAGANTVSGLSFGFADPTALQDDARRKAMADARRKAELYAAAAGVKLGEVREISEISAASPAPYQTLMFRAKEASAVPIAAGQSTVNANVAIVYALE